MLGRTEYLFKWTLYAAGVVICWLVHGLLLQHWVLFGAMPFIFPMLTALIAMYEGPFSGSVCGIVLGVACDLVIAAPIPCFYTLIFPIAAMLAGLMSKPKAKIPLATLHGYCKVVERTSTEFFPTKTPWLSNALVFIRRHLNDGISAKDVIAHLGYSHTTVSKVFRNEIGSSIQQEIIRLRFEQACRLLKETTRTAADIAAECGYPSAQYFAHLFSAKFDMTPDVWRRKGK